MQGKQRRKEAKREEEKGRKKKTKRGVLEEDVQGLFLWRLLKFLVNEGIWRVVVIFLRDIFWIGLRTCRIVSLRFVCMCWWCLM